MFCLMSNKIMKEKYDSTITIVTAFFDIGRGNLQSKEELPDYMTRTNDTYFEYFSNLATLDNPMVIFSDNEHIERIKSSEEISLLKLFHLILINLRKHY